LKQHFSTIGAGEAGKDPQQAGFARTVGAFNLHNIATVDLETEIIKQNPLFTDTSEVACRQ
jgi:hypothetical protein